MNIPAEIAATITIVGALGLLVVWFGRSRGNETIRLLEINIQGYKDAEKFKDQRIAYLEGQLIIKDETIKRLISADKSPKKSR